MVFNEEVIRAKLVSQYPLFTKIICELEWEEDNTQPTVCTNGVKLKYNREFMEARTVVDQIFILLHEICHVFCGHPVRMMSDKYIDEYRQQAGDYAVNSLLIEMGLDRPYDALYDYRYKDLAAEEIYHKIKQPQPPPQPQGGRGRFDDHPDAKGADEKTAQKMEQEIVNKQLEAMATARLCGTLSSNVERLLGNMTEPVKDWKELLAEYMVVAMSKDDYTFTKPNRRYNDGMIMPDLFGERPPAIGLFGDTSGSISSEECKSMASEIMGFIEDVDPEELYVIWCDSSVKSVQVFDDMDKPELEPKGGGGTNFRPPFEWIDENNVELELAVYFTDGCCHRFPDPPPYDVVWLVWDKRIDFKPPFGEVIYMEL